MPDYRALSEDEMEDFHSFVRYAFSMTEGPRTPDDADSDDDDDDSERGTSYGYFVDDDLVSVCRHYHWQTWVRGEQHPLVGLSAVATPPEHRRSGYVRSMLEAALTEYRADGDYLSALWPFKHPFYERLGWGTAYSGYEYECDPSVLAQFRGGHDGTWTPMEADDWERLNPVHDAHGAAYELTIKRREQWWRGRIFEGWKQDPFVYGYERDGELAAYVSFIAEDEDDDTVLRTRDAAWVDMDARRALLGFLARHESQVDTIHLWSVDDDLLWMADDPREFDIKVHPAAMFRLVDVPAALEALSYPPDIEASVVLDVQDSLADWNDDTFRLDIADGTAVVERTDEETVDATFDIATFSQLYVGARDVSFFHRTGEIEVDDETASILASCFPERDVLLREGF